MTRQSVTRPEVRVGGHWMSSIAAWGGLRHSTNRKGSIEVSWTIAVDVLGRHWRHPALVYGALVEVYLGPIVLWVGTLDEPDWDSGQMVASGAPRDGETAASLDGSGTGTTKPETAIAAAIARDAVTWSGHDAIGDTAVGNADDAGGLVTLASVLDAWAETNGTGWAIDMNRRVVEATTNEAVVTWHVVPGSGVLGSAADDRVDRVLVRYVFTTSGNLATATFGTGRIEKTVDITDRGYMTSAAATDVAESIWNDHQPGWTNGLTLRRGQVTTPGGVIADLALIKGGDTIRLLGVPDPRGVAHNLNVVVEDTDYDWTEDEIQVNPVGRSARDNDSVLEQIGNLAVDAMAKATTKSVTPEWVTYVPTIGGGWVLSNGTLAGRFFRDGNLIHYEIEYTVGSTDTKSGTLRFALPTSATGALYTPMGQAHIHDISVPQPYVRFVSRTATSNQIYMHDTGMTAVSNTVPFTFATGDTIFVSGSYRPS